MIWLVSGSTRTVAQHAHLGVLIVPKTWSAKVPLGRPWAMDNGCFTGLDVDAFLAMVRRYGHTSPHCLFVTCPDVVGNAAETLALWRTWSGWIRHAGLPVSYVLQDGEDGATVPWVELDAVFVGGSTEYKLSRTAASIVGYARARGKWAHMGRVNTRRRARYAEDIGCQSVDGTGFSMFGDEYVRRTQRWAQQPRLALA